MAEPSSSEIAATGSAVVGCLAPGEPKTTLLNATAFIASNSRINRPSARYLGSPAIVLPAASSRELVQAIADRGHGSVRRHNPLGREASPTGAYSSAVDPSGVLLAVEFLASRRSAGFIWKIQEELDIVRPGEVRTCGDELLQNLAIGIFRNTRSRNMSKVGTAKIQRNPKAAIRPAQIRLVFIYYQDAESFLAGERWGDTKEDAARAEEDVDDRVDGWFETESESTYSHVFEFDQALDGLLACALRRRQWNGQIRLVDPPEDRE